MPVSDSPPSDATPVVLVAVHTLIGDSVAMALAQRGLVMTKLDWAHPSDAPDVGSIDRGLLIADLDNERTIVRARHLVASMPLSWTVLTGARRGPLWGAVLDAGAVAVLPSSTSLENLSDRLQADTPQEDPQRPEREELVSAWQELWRDRTDKLARLSTLSPREAQVLRLLYRGEQVASIALQFGVTPSTVRSQVKAVLRKLGVNTQLAAVAIYAYARLDVGLRSVRHEETGRAEPEHRQAVTPLPTSWGNARPSGGPGPGSTLGIAGAGVFHRPEAPDTGALAATPARVSERHMVRGRVAAPPTNDD